MHFSMLPVRLTAFLTLATLLSTLPAAADDVATCAHASGDESIAACTREIYSGRFAGAGIAWAYNNRGNGYRAKGDNDRAIQDYDQAIVLNPKYAFAYNNRGNAYQAKGDNDRAIADFSQAIVLEPNYAHPYLARGRLYFFSKAVTMAESDFKKASELNPKYAYGALWLDLTERRIDVPSHLAEAATQLDMTAWPAPLVRLYLGQMTPADVLAAAQNADARTMKGQVCEANFYSGELALLQGKRDNAIRLFRLAATDCPLDFVESPSATAELKGLGAAP
jgi:lipoprotein NlpI